MAQPGWYNRITQPWSEEKQEWERDNFDQIVGWESNWDWEKGVRNTIFKLKDKTTKTFTSTF